MKLTYYGHSSLAVEVAGKTLLFDPFISPNPRAKHIEVVAMLEQLTQTAAPQALVIHQYDL